MRLGHPARLLSVVQEHSLDALLSNSEATAIVRDVRKDIDEILVRKIQHVVPKNIHTFPTEVYWKLQGGRGISKARGLQRKYEDWC